MKKSKEWALLGASSLLAGGLLTGNACAHDDGLTCHTHGGGSGSSIQIRYTVQAEDHSAGEVGVILEDTLVGNVHGILHQVDIRAALTPSAFDPRELRKFRTALAEFQRRIFLVMLLIDNSEAATNQKESDNLRGAARTVFDTDGLEDFVAFWDLRNLVKSAQPLNVDFYTLSRHLQTRYGFSSELMAALGDAAAWCGGNEHEIEYDIGAGT